jgi:hypothetical protein
MPPKFQDPFPIYKPGESPRKVYGVDYPCWALDGWSKDPPGTVTPPEPEAPPIISADPSFAQPTAYDRRKAELDSLIAESGGWANIQRIANELGIAEKPDGGWKDAIPLILEKEGLAPA